MTNCTWFTAGRTGMRGWEGSPHPLFPIYFPAGTVGTFNTTNCERLLYNLLFNFENNTLAVRDALRVWRRNKNMPLKQRSMGSSSLLRAAVTLPRFQKSSYQTALYWDVIQINSAPALHSSSTVAESVPEIHMLSLE